MSKPSKKWIIAGAVVLCASAFIALFGVTLLERIIGQSVEKKIAVSPYFKCEEVVLKLRPASLIFRNAVLDIDLKAEAKHMEVKSSEIALDGINWFQFIFFKRLIINDLRIESPFVMLSEMLQMDSLAIEEKAHKIEISSVQIAHLSLDRGHFKTVKFPRDTVASMTADTFDIDMDGLSFEIDNKGASRTVKQLNLDIQNLRFHSDDKLHEIHLSRLLFSKNDDLITLTDLTVKPKYAKREFFAHVDKKRARLDFEFPEIVFHGWQFEQLLQGKFVASSAVINGMKLQVLANQNLPIDAKHYEPLPQEALLKASLGITVDSVLVKNGQLEFENIALGKSKAGLLSFNDLNAVFTNVTNDSARIRKQPILAVEVVGNFQHRHQITNNFWMDLSSPDYAFTFKGRTGAIPFTQFNSLLTPSSNIVFEKGSITKMTFEANANKSVARGKLNLEYNGLEFHWLNKNKQKSKSLSKIVDFLFVKDENNAEDLDFQKGEIYWRRDTKRPFFGYWWFAIQSGLKTSILSDFEIEIIRIMKSKKQSK